MIEMSSKIITICLTKLGGFFMKPETPRIPQATTKRLPLYYRFLQSFHNAGHKRVSSQELSEAMKIDSATIRRDFSHFGALGKKGYGYDVPTLLEFFRKTLDQDEAANVALIGVGSLGTAFLKYNFQKNHNTKIVVAFDTKAPVEGTTISDIPVYHSSVMLKKLEEYGIELVIFTLPSRAAQQVADQLEASSIKGILNFTPIRIQTTDAIRVHTIDLSVELQTLIYLIRNEHTE